MNFEDLEYNSFLDLEYASENEAASFQTIFYITNLLRSSSLDEDRKLEVERNLEAITQKEASEIIINLKSNQLDKFRDTNRYGQRELTKHINTML